MWKTRFRIIICISVVKYSFLAVCINVKKVHYIQVKKKYMKKLNKK